MKKLLLCILSFFMLINNTYALSAQSYIAYDMDTNRVLMGKNIHSQRLIASISKIMTAIVAIENSDLTKEVKVTKDILKVCGSSIYLEPGEKITLENLLYGMMMRSGNDAAYMIAISVSDTMEDFVKLMNEYAQKIGMNNTYFINSHGLENEYGDGNKSSAYDMALLTSYAFSNKTFRKIFKTKNYTCKSNLKTYSWQNKNKLLNEEYITGGKTGYTIKAKRTLVSTGFINNTNIVIVTLNDSDDWTDHKYLYNKIKDEYQNINVLNKNKFNILDDTVYIEDTLYIKNNFNMLLKKTEIENLKIKYYLYNGKYYNNKKVGKASIYLNNKLIHSEDIFIKKTSIKSFTFFKKIFKKY